MWSTLKPITHSLKCSHCLGWISLSLFPNILKAHRVIRTVHAVFTPHFNTLIIAGCWLINLLTAVKLGPLTIYELPWQSRFKNIICRTRSAKQRRNALYYNTNNKTDATHAMVIWKIYDDSFAKNRILQRCTTHSCENINTFTLILLQTNYTPRKNCTEYKYKIYTIKIKKCRPKPLASGEPIV